MITSPNGTIYIGQSTDIRHRWVCHKCHSRIKYEYPLYRSFKKYGVDRHEFKILHQLPEDIDRKILTDYEQLYMDQYKECGFRLLNANPVAGSRLGTKQSYEARMKVSRSQRGKPKKNANQTSWVINYNKTRVITDEMREKWSETHKRNHAGRPNYSKGFTGGKHTDETKLFLKQNWLGRKHTPETRKKMSEIAFIREENKRRQNGL